jgi:uncharacterized membrane protein
VALALSSATATYSLFALAAIGRTSFAAENGNSVPAITVLFGLILAVATLGQFAHLVQRVFESIQIGGILRTLSRRAWQVIDDVHPHPDSGVPTLEPLPPLSREVTSAQHAGKPGVIAAIDRKALIKVANDVGGIIEVVPQIGEFVSARTTVLKAHEGKREITEAEARSVFVLARQRTIDQDPAFLMRLLVDIGIRALSAAINDPTTSVQVIDRIEAMLVELWDRHPGPTYVADADGVAKAFVRAPTWEDYFELGSSEIRHYGMRSVQVHRRLRAMHLHLLEVVAGPDRERVLVELRLINEAAETMFKDPAELALSQVPDRLGIGGV